MFFILFLLLLLLCKGLDYDLFKVKVLFKDEIFCATHTHILLFTFLFMV